ncbi:RNA polymerase sigma factor [Anaerovorax odorimutans]|uniref:RNA polymerase sigma factor n=1 Tax=Anaerovorax odorimutans TaxID=109327 RepID=A0ABT1RNG5_9FIRM|nr:RNA polymerase sigma factor [Anaerovorax odorimutans]MCQ4636714.1 RNA polymerase sigma factor [Anaerovorax odorimutans]
MTREANLLKKIEQGDLTYLDELIACYYPDIFRYCLWHTENRQTAEDAAQETFLRFVRYFDRMAYRNKVKAYLYKIAANVCIDMRTKRRSEELPENLSMRERGYEEAEDEADFLRLVRNLPQHQQELVILRFGQDLTLRECAQVTGLPLRTVQSRLRSALKKIERQLRKGGKENEYE